MDASKHTLRGFTIGRGDDYSFEIIPARRIMVGGFGSDADLNGFFPTRRAALDRLLEHLEADRRELNAAIARAKKMRRAAKVTGEPT